MDVTGLIGIHGVNQRVLDLGRLWQHSTPMRTTLDIDDGLYELVRTQAESSHQTISEFIQSVVRQSVHAPVQDTIPPFRLITIRSGLPAGMRVESTSAIAEDSAAFAGFDRQQPAP